MADAVVSVEHAHSILMQVSALPCSCSVSKHAFCKRMLYTSTQKIGSKCYSIVQHCLSVQRAKHSIFMHAQSIAKLY
jgi:hypothetical protein